MGDFQAATAVAPRGVTDGLHEYDVTLDGQRSVGTKLHGGYLLAVLGRAAADVVGAVHPHLSAVSGAFLRAPEVGPAVVSVETLRAGRSATNLRARLSQDGQPCVEALITQGTLDEADPWWSGLAPAELPAEQDCFLSTAEPPGAPFRVPLMEVIDQRLDPSRLGFAMGTPSKEGVVAGWQRLADGSDWDPLSLLVALDPVPPVSFDLGLSGWVPTLQLTAYIRRLPAPGPVRVRMAATDVGNDRMDEVAHVWDSKDRLVGQATQLAAVRIPRSASLR